MSLVAEHETEARIAYTEHFLRLAHHGRHRGASGGEKRARALAKAIVDQVPGLDGQAVAGAIEFMRLAAAKPGTARDIIQ